MANDDLNVREVDLLSVTKGTLCYHNIAISRSATYLLMLAVLAMSGCSSEIEVARETTTASPATEQAQPVVTERSRTAVALDLTRGQEPVKTVSGDLVVSRHDPNVVIVEGCVHLHIHVCKDDRKSQKLAVEILARVAAVSVASPLIYGDSISQVTLSAAAHR